MTDSVFSVLENPKQEIYLDLKAKLLTVGADTIGVSPPVSASVLSGKDSAASDDFVATLPTSPLPSTRYIYEREYIDAIQLTKTLVSRGFAKNEETGGNAYGVPDKGIVAHPLGHQLKIVLREILKHNGLNMGVLYRGACNLSTYGKDRPKPHVDHSFPHVGMLIYLNTSEGDTVICREQEDFSAGPNQNGQVCEAPIESMTTAATITPEEDKVIIMNGANYHYNHLPPEGAEGRVVIVATFNLR